MAKLYDSLDAKILEAISELGPRNFAEVARRVGIPQESLRYRFRRMNSNPHIFLRCHATIYHTNLGLKKAVAVLTANPGMEHTMLECLKVHGYWIYVSRFYGKGEGCLATYTIPAERCDKFEEFIQRIGELGVARSSQLFWATCFQPGCLTSAWFDEEIGEWSFRWDEWAEQVQNETVDLPYTLKDPDRFHNYADQIDVFMLKELEKDATKSIQEISDMLGISLQGAFYHYRKHLIAKKLLEDFEIFIYPHDAALCNMYFFFLAFPSYETMAKFANSLLNKHFVRYIGKILNANKILGEFLLPREEFRRFIDKLSFLARMKLIQSYDYVIMDLKTGQRQTFAYELLSDGRWLYDHRKHLADLRRVTRRKQERR